jgi:hypothetical protein
MAIACVSVIDLRVSLSLLRLSLQPDLALRGSYLQLNSRLRGALGIKTDPPPPAALIAAASAPPVTPTVAPLVHPVEEGG